MGSVQRDFPNHYQTIQPHSVFYKALSTINRLVFTIANRTITNKVTMAQKQSQAGNFTNLLILLSCFSLEYLNGIGSKRFYRLPIEFLKTLLQKHCLSQNPHFSHIFCRIRCAHFIQGLLLGVLSISYIHNTNLILSQY